MAEATWGEQCGLGKPSSDAGGLQTVQEEYS